MPTQVTSTAASTSCLRRERHREHLPGRGARAQKRVDDQLAPHRVPLPAPALDHAGSGGERQQAAEATRHQHRRDPSRWRRSPRPRQGSRRRARPRSRRPRRAGPRPPAPAPAAPPRPPPRSRRPPAPPARRRAREEERRPRREKAAARPKPAPPDARPPRGRRRSAAAARHSRRGAPRPRAHRVVDREPARLAEGVRHARDEEEQAGDDEVHERPPLVEARGPIRGHRRPRGAPGPADRSTSPAGASVQRRRRAASPRAARAGPAPGAGPRSRRSPRREKRAPAAPPPSAAECRARSGRTAPSRPPPQTVEPWLHFTSSA